MWTWWRTHGGEHVVKVLILNDKAKKEPVCFLVNRYEPETNTWDGHTCLKDCTRRQQKRYKDTCQINWLIKNNGWDTKYSLVSTWQCEEAILK